MSRAVTLHITAEQHAQLNANTEPQAVEKAIGYLSTWGLARERYVDCHISVSYDCEEMTACYYDSPRVPSPVDGQWPRPTFVIGAVWHGDHFGFHS